MKIEIDTNWCSYEAKVTIEGREMKYGYRKGGWSYLSGIEAEEQESTVGGIVATALSGKIIDILQGHLPEDENPETNSCYEAWDKLPEHISEDILEKVDGF